MGLEALHPGWLRCLGGLIDEGIFSSAFRTKRKFFDDASCLGCDAPDQKVRGRTVDAGECRVSGLCAEETCGLFTSCHLSVRKNALCAAGKLQLTH
jgi:hypothetical protein